MSDGIMLVFGEDGVAREYDDTWDITIHCESEEEQKAVWEKLNNLNREVNNLTDTISRQTAIELAMQYCPDDDGTCSKADEDIRNLLDELEDLPPAQTEQHEIGYSECANAMLKMWIDNVLTDGEYSRIMDKLNAHWEERRKE